MNNAIKILKMASGGVSPWMLYRGHIWGGK